MSELMNAYRNWKSFRRQLLTSVSGFALLTSSGCITAVIAADDTDRPVVWIELGGQLEEMENGQQPFVPSFASAVEHAGFISPLVIQRPPRFSSGAEGKIVFQPDGSDWSLTASVRYGRSNSIRNIHQQTLHGPQKVYLGVRYIETSIDSRYEFADSSATSEETHAVVDFSVGKDIGIGLFGSGGSSRFGFGVRFAQFASKSTLSLNADPNLFPNPYGPQNLKYARHQNLYTAAAIDTRSFRGIGPSLSLDGAAQIAGNSENLHLSFDWGANIAMLFGKQKATGHSKSSDSYHYTKGAKYLRNSYTSHIANHNRSRTVVVPNLGGFAGLSFRYAAAKVSFGYRGDFFFGAIDGGIDTAHKESVSFHGPYATVSVGLGG